MNNKEIITSIIEDLENTIGLNWPTRKTKINREKLIECWSEYREYSEYKFYNYKSAAPLCNTYKKIFSNINKVTQESWKTYILRKNKYKFCPKCKELLYIDIFQIDNRTISNFQVYCKICNTDYYKEHKTESSARSAKRRAAKLLRTPNWLTEQDYKEIQNFYVQAKKQEQQTGIKYHVDHIIPLQGRLVSGLHIPTNLQILTQETNLSKSNTFMI